MPRPQKPRIICHQPQYLVFGPKGKRANSTDRITMLIDELETIRLIDYLNYTQEEAAEQMNVARTTVQRIYNDARKKISTSLIDGKIIVIEGGEFTICNDNCEDCLEPLRIRRRQGKNRF
ncbi:MAG: DUF134 domain-containing protein [Candidatus Izemoplasmatales bacterium]